MQHTANSCLSFHFAQMQTLKSQEKQKNLLFFCLNLTFHLFSKQQNFQRVNKTYIFCLINFQSCFHFKLAKFILESGFGSKIVLIDSDPTKTYETRQDPDLQPSQAPTFRFKSCGVLYNCMFITVEAVDLQYIKLLRLRIGKF